MLLLTSSGFAGLIAYIGMTNDTSGGIVIASILCGEASLFTARLPQRRPAILYRKIMLEHPHSYCTDLQIPYFTQRRSLARCRYGAEAMANDYAQQKGEAAPHLEWPGWRVWRCWRS